VKENEKREETVGGHGVEDTKLELRGREGKGKREKYENGGGA
jgi:hypothetical protein